MKIVNDSVFDLNMREKCPEPREIWVHLPSNYMIRTWLYFSLEAGKTLNGFKRSLKRLYGVKDFIFLNKTFVLTNHDLCVSLLEEGNALVVVSAKSPKPIFKEE